MLRMRLTLAAVVFGTLLFGLNAAPAQQADEEEKLIAVLQSPDSSLHDKVLACKRLALIGTERCVPAVAKLLPDEHLSCYARFALEPLPTEAADEALRAALGSLSGRLRIGVINSLGNRRDAKSVEPLSKLMLEADLETAEAAAAALGRIATPEAAEKLGAAVQNVSDPQRKTVIAHGCITCAAILRQENNPDLALKLYDAVAKADVPQHLKVAGIRGLVITQGKEGLALLEEKLRSQSAAEFAIALRAARELQEDGVTNVLVNRIGQETDDTRKEKLLLALADRTDPDAAPTFVAAAREGSKQVKLAAIVGLAKLQWVEAADLLVELALSDDADVATTAFDTLASLDDPKITQTILKLLDSTRKERLLLGIRLAGEKRLAKTTPKLFDLAGSAEAEIRNAALEALGATVSIEELSTLVDRLAKAKDADERQAAQAALRLASVRMPEADACAATIAGKLYSVPFETQDFLLQLLRDIGGAKALEVVAATARKDDPQLQDAATRVLGEWLTPDAAPVLIDLAQSLQDRRLQIRCLRGYIRIIRQLNVPNQERLEMCKKAMSAATRPDERRLVLEAVGRIPTVAALQYSAGYLTDESLAEAASEAVVAIAEKLLNSRPAVVIEPLQKVLEVTKNQELKVRAQLFLNRARRAAGK